MLLRRQESRVTNGAVCNPGLLPAHEHDGVSGERVTRKPLALRFGAPYRASL